MPSLTDFQNSTIKILDYLYFQDIVSIQSFTGEKLKLYNKLVAFLDMIACGRGLDGYKFEHYKHLLLCSMDSNILQLEGLNELVVQDTKNIVTLLSARIEREIVDAGFNLHDFWSDIKFLLTLYPVNKMSNAVRYKIVNQVLNYEYDNLTEAVFSKFMDYGF